MADFVHQALDTGAIRMLTTGEERRQFIHIDDVCRAFHEALSGGVREICDASTFEWFRVLDVANMVGEMTGANVVLGNNVGNTPITPNLAPIPGWKARVTLREGLARMVEDFRRRKTERKDAG